MKTLATLLALACATLSAKAQFLFPQTNAAPSVTTLAWFASTAPNVAGYKLYWGTGSRQYSSVTNTGTALSCTLTNLAYGTNYFFAATAYSSGGIESPLSGEISYTPVQSLTNTPPTPPTMKPVIVLTADIWITVDNGQVAIVGSSLNSK